MSYQSAPRNFLKLGTSAALYLMVVFSTFAMAEPPSTPPSSQPSASSLEIRRFTFKFLPASHAAEVIEKIFLVPAEVQSGAAADMQAFGYVRSVVAEPQTNSVIVVGDEVALDHIRRILDDMDPAGDIPRSEIRIFEFRGQVAKGAAEVLNTLFKRDAAPAANSASRNYLRAAALSEDVLVVAADRDVMRIAQDLIKPLAAEDGEHAFELTTVHVSHTSPARAAKLLRKLFSAGFRSNRDLNESFNAVGDEERKIVILAGSKMWVHRAEQALEEMDEAPAATQRALPAK